MSATTDAAALQPSAAWLAAYALGLAYSEGSDQQCLTDLLAATRGRTEPLDAAHRRLDAAEVAERSICEGALRLLDRARNRAQPDSAREHGRPRFGPAMARCLRVER